MNSHYTHDSSNIRKSFVFGAFLATVLLAGCGGLNESLSSASGALNDFNNTVEQIDRSTQQVRATAGNMQSTVGGFNPNHP